jgi:hypothetical protein
MSHRPFGYGEPPALDGERLWDRPDWDIPVIPAQITEVADRDLMALFSQFLSWENYVAEELVRAEVEELRAENHYKLTEAKFIAGYESDLKTGRVTAAKAAAKMDTAVEQASSRYVSAYAMRKVLAEQQASLARTSAFISRELSRRIGRDPVERRSLRMNP